MVFQMKAMAIIWQFSRGPTYNGSPSIEDDTCRPWMQLAEGYLPGLNAEF